MTTRQAVMLCEILFYGSLIVCGAMAGFIFGYYFWGVQ